MTEPDPTIPVRSALQRFQDGYTARNLDRLDHFMELFAPDPEIELIGIGASARNAHEWFVGPQRIREIVESDWRFWGDVRLDVEGAQINVQSDVAWLSATGAVVQTDHIQDDQVFGFFLQQMQELLQDDQASSAARMMEATHFGLRRLRERAKPAGHRWPFVLTAVLVLREGQWRFHTLHWSMPVD